MGILSGNCRLIGPKPISCAVLNAFCKVISEIIDFFYFKRSVVSISKIYPDILPKVAGCKPTRQMSALRLFTKSNTVTYIFRLLLETNLLSHLFTFFVKQIESIKA